MMGKFVVKGLNKYCISKNIANHNKEKIHWLKLTVKELVLSTKFPKHFFHFREEPYFKYFTRIKVSDFPQKDI